MNGFFSPSQFIKEPSIPAGVSHCGSCKLHKHCRSPKIKPSGEGRKKILIVAEAPGEREDLKGVPFAGEASQKLQSILNQIGIDLHKDCWKTNAVICKPKKGGSPSDAEIKACSPNVFNTIKTLKPVVIVLLGGSAIKAVIGAMKKEDASISQWVGWNIPCQLLNAWICPTYHPSFLLHAQNTVLEKRFKEHLKKAASHKEIPWPSGSPSFKNEVEIIYRPFKAASLIKEWSLCRKPTGMAFDYETNCLKPEYHKAEIVSCSVCWQGEKTIAFPWAGEVIDSMRELLKSQALKIASNLKFEDRWTRYMMHTRVRHWAWDTMIASHVIDNRAQITGLKFQSYVELGQPKYNTHIEDLLKHTDSSHLNRIKEIDLKDLLLYNGLDSLLEYKLAQIQMRKLHAPYNL